MDKYTVTCNYDEYAEGLFETEALANAYRAKKILVDEPDAKEGMSVEELLEFDSEGYYRTLRITVEDK